MPYLVTLFPQSRVGLVSGSGHVTGQELAHACGEMVHDARWESGFSEVWDLSGAAEVDISPDELTGLVESAHEYADRIGEARCAFVTTRDGVIPLLRLFERLTADLDRTYATVRTRTEAEAWLGLAPGALAPEPLADGA